MHTCIHTYIHAYIHYIMCIHTYRVQIKIKFPFRIRRTLAGSTLRRVITEGTLEPCHLHLVLSKCLIALVVAAVDITKSMNIIVGHVDNPK